MKYIVPLIIILALAYATTEFLDIPMLTGIKNSVNNAVDSGAIGDAKKAVSGAAGGILGQAKQAMADNLASDIATFSRTNKAACMVDPKQCVKIKDCSSAAQVGQNGLIASLPDGISSISGAGVWPTACTFTLTDAMGNSTTSKPFGITAP